jgi:hypothetical protein
VDVGFLLLGAAGFGSGVWLGSRVPPPLWAVLCSGFLMLLSLKVLATPINRPTDLLLLAAVTWVLSCPMVGGSLGAAINPDMDE